MWASSVVKWAEVTQCVKWAEVTQCVSEKYSEMGIGDSVYR